jgi:YVTN family beta-propeller protein
MFSKQTQVFLIKSTVSVIDTTTNTLVGSPIKVGDQPTGIEYDPVNKKMYVASIFQKSLNILVFFL